LRLHVSSRWDHDADADGRIPLLTVSASGKGVYGIERRDELLLEGQVFGRRGVRFESLGSRTESYDVTG
jgi:hypothetical protein